MGSYTSEDPNLALLTYRSTPLQNGLSLSELPMGPRLKTQLPVLPNTLKPKAQDLHTVKQKEDDCRSKQQKNFNLRYRARDLPNLHKGDKVWVRDQSREAEVVSKTPHPRSYLVKTEKGVLRRNRSALVSLNPTGKKCPEHNKQIHFRLNPLLIKQRLKFLRQKNVEKKTLYRNYLPRVQAGL